MATHRTVVIKASLEYSLCLVISFFSFFVLGLHVHHMEVPGLGVELELQLLAYTTARATPDPSHVCDLHHNLWQCRILHPLREARHNYKET